MPLSFQTKRDPEAGLLPEGVYKFVVEAAKEEAGTEFPYAALRLRPIVKGKKWNSMVFENLSSSPESRFRVDQFMDSVNAPNEEGNAGITWFIGKVGWARFFRETGRDGIVRPKVKAYLTEEQAEKQISKMVEQEASDDDTMVVSTRRSSRPVPEPEESAPTRARRKATAAVLAENADTDEDIPF